MRMACTVTVQKPRKRRQQQQQQRLQRRRQNPQLLKPRRRTPPGPLQTRQVFTVVGGACQTSVRRSRVRRLHLEREYQRYILWSVWLFVLHCILLPRENEPCAKAMFSHDFCPGGRGVGQSKSDLELFPHCGTPQAGSGGNN